MSFMATVVIDDRKCRLLTRPVAERNETLDKEKVTAKNNKLQMVDPSGNAILASSFVNKIFTVRIG